MASLALVTPPASAPVSVAAVKDWARIDGTYDDGLLESLIDDATAYLDGKDGVLGRCLMSQTWKLVLNAFANEIQFPLSPVTAVSSVKYYDEDGVLQTLAAGYYRVDLYSEPQRIVLASGASWPAVSENINAVEVQFIAGYADADSVPGAIKRAIMEHATHLYDNRDSSTPPGYAELIAPLRTIPI